MGLKMDYENDEVSFIDTSGIVKKLIIYKIMIKDFIKYKRIIDENLISISEGDTQYDIEYTKKRILSFLKSKTKKQRIGSIAEFFMHLFLQQLEFTRECLFSNLEENSLKKGFDGLYTKKKSFWIAESKSSETSENLHSDNIKRAVTDLNDKILGRTNNDPFRNAVHHIKAARDNYNKGLIKIIRLISVEYSRGEFRTASEYNIIPVSTLYIYNNQTNEDLKKAIVKIVEKYTFKEIIVICFDNHIYDDFMKYLEG
ncbi:conserved hypothetical protein [Alteracholeplasma palmae J233]|uniref:Anti-bacteriophage protein A/HamA C-terminal domain-containing protein n=1 Tax=Alteracholeplasma palmae (strain ATCC 49389 / J233) TaxID=1318466 RepID=U4KJY1_ALTPJ|nr:hypothetical protein [Alteracholeplasma palmae]CCV63894.1 conserved hypothetical protein [Alteracholeplasma palmae J233]